MSRDGFLRRGDKIALFIGRGTSPLQVREDAQPIFLKARPVPYALKEKVEQELQRLEDEGIHKVDWAAPVVLVPKKLKMVH